MKIFLLQWKNNGSVENTEHYSWQTAQTQWINPVLKVITIWLKLVVKMT